MFDTSILTKQLLIDARKLQQEGFYKSAILSYSHYLEQMLLTAAGSKYKDKPDEFRKFFNKVLKMRDADQLNFYNIMKIVGEEIPISSITSQCDEVRTIRNGIAAHHVSTVGIGYSSSSRDVNDYKKIIRRMYKFVKREQKLPSIEIFLNTDPLRIHSRLPEIVLELESEIMEYLCKKTEKTVLDITFQLFPRTTMLDELIHNRSRCGKICLFL